MTNTQQGFFQLDPITVTNVLQKSPEEINEFMNANILSTYLPGYGPNQTPDIDGDLRWRLSKYSNDKGYVTTLYNTILVELFKQKEYKRTGQKDKRDEGIYTQLEAKSEILYRVWLTLDRYYEAASRLMSGIGGPDPRQSRHH